MVVLFKHQSFDATSLKPYETSLKPGKHAVLKKQSRTGLRRRNLTFDFVLMALYKELYTV